MARRPGAAGTAAGLLLSTVAGCASGGRATATAAPSASALSTPSATVSTSSPSPTPTATTTPAPPAALPKGNFSVCVTGRCYWQLVDDALYTSDHTLRIGPEIVVSYSGQHPPKSVPVNVFRTPIAGADPGDHHQVPIGTRSCLEGLPPTM